MTAPAGHVTTVGTKAFVPVLQTRVTLPPAGDWLADGLAGLERVTDGEAGREGDTDREAGGEGDTDREAGGKGDTDGDTRMHCT